MEPANEARQFPDDCLAPEAQFDSREALLASINAWAAPRGYAFTTSKSTTETSGKRTVTYACDRAGRPGAHISKDGKLQRRRHTSSRAIGCQFSINAKESLDKTHWYIRHRPGSQFSVHNHEPSYTISAHPAHRALSSTDEATIGRLTNAGVAPRDIRTYLRQNSATTQSATQQDIQNCIAKAKRELCQGQSTIQALANGLDDQGFWNRMQLDEHGWVTAVLFAHPESLAYLKSYPELLILDCDKTHWYIRHRPGSQFSVHNHEPSYTISAHPAHRALSSTDEATIGRLTNAGVAPRDIRTYLRQNSATTQSATQQDIQNCIAKAKRELCQGQSTIQALANGLDDQGFWNRMQLDEHDRVTAVLFAHPESLAYLKSYPELLILDCTYKTNKYKMPLLDMVGDDSCGRTFCIAFAFLSNEAEEDYFWALDRLGSIYELFGASYPSVIVTDRCLACMNAVARCFPASAALLCRWHANMAVTAYCKPAFINKEDPSKGNEQWLDFYSCWFSIINSIDEAAYTQQLEDFERRHIPQYVREVTYIKETWLDLYKERLVNAWVDRYLHFNTKVTSRVEGIHALVKGRLKNSQEDLFIAWNKIKLAVNDQLAELRANQSYQQIQKPFGLSGQIYNAVYGWVSHKALRLVDEQKKRLEGDNNLPPCMSRAGSAWLEWTAGRFRILAGLDILH
ncbi:hypothetical protein HIM_10168 [Hirsutella minnesotensis 3608]|uniref:MULE transposase domain-containing protein n=1 Tax=Hirsutella minnesotensis 3608 TaxID=1043627 RepID=A0A0F7ZKC7_9HYPO|nr:hypothetical protein HIM_10168 [Hirsutella minnesotensis 3608]